MELKVIDRLRPFSCGSQEADWSESNCARCKKLSPSYAPFDQVTCEIERAIGEAYMSDGTVSAEIGRRMGYDPARFVWPCTEVEWTDEWKAEYRRRQTWRYRLRKWWQAKRSDFRRWRDDRRYDRRMKIAEREHIDGVHCWASWVLWAMGGDPAEEKPSTSGAKNCREDAMRAGASCYCGKYQSEAVPAQGAAR